MYKFSNNTFSTLVATYDCSNAGTTFGAVEGYPLYVYGDFAYYSWTDITKINFVSNSAPTTIALPTIQNNAFEIGTNQTSITQGNCPLSTKYVKMGNGNTSTRVYVFDLEVGAFVAQLRANASSSALSAHYPLHANNVPFSYTGTVNIITESAITARTLTTPLTKTSANGMTATYELEVYW
jgi:hypothetical protein